MSVADASKNKRICNNDSTDPIQTSSQSNTVSIYHHHSPAQHLKMKYNPALIYHVMGFTSFFCPLTNLHKLCLSIIRCEQLRRSRVRTRSNPSGGNLKLIPLDLLNKNLVRPRLQFQIRTVAITCRTWTPPCFSATAAALPERPFFSSIHRSTRLAHVKIKGMLMSPNIFSSIRGLP